MHEHIYSQCSFGYLDIFLGHNWSMGLRGKVMESLEHAEKRGANIIAEYLGGAITCDAYHMTDPRSDGLGVSSCITKSLEDAGVSAEEVGSILCTVSD